MKEKHIESIKGRLFRVTFFRGRNMADFPQYGKIVFDELINIWILFNAPVDDVRLLFIVVNEAFRVSEGLWKGENLRNLPGASRIEPKNRVNSENPIRVPPKHVQNTKNWARTSPNINWTAKC